MNKFISCYESIKLMDKRVLLSFPLFSKDYKFESDMQTLIQNSNRKDGLKEFLWMIKLIRIKNLQVNYEKLLFYLFDNLSYHEGETSFVESFDIYRKAIRYTIKALLKNKWNTFDLERTLTTSEKLLEKLINIITPISENANIVIDNTNIDKNLQGELQQFLSNFVDKKELEYDEISFFKYLSVSIDKFTINFLYMIRLIVYIMNEICLCKTFKSTFNRGFYIRYQNFIINFAKYIIKFIDIWPLVWNILNEILIYFIKEAKNGSFVLEFKMINLFIDDLLMIMSEKLSSISENFLKVENDIFTNFITLLKNLKNSRILIDSIILILCVNKASFGDNFMNQQSFTESLLKIAKIFKPIISTNFLSDMLYQQKIRYILEFILFFPSQYYLINYLIENQIYYNLCLSIDLFIEKKLTPLLKDIKEPRSNIIALFFQPQLSYQNIFKLFSSEFFQLDSDKSLYVELLIRAEFNVSKEPLKNNINFFKQMINFIQKEWSIPKAKGYRLLLHFLITLPKEFISQEISYIEFFNETFDFILHDLNETYEFLKFEAKRIDFLLKIPEIYHALIEKIYQILINLTNDPEISDDDQNFIIFQAKYAEFFNLSLFFLSFPLILQTRKKFRFCRFQEDNKKKEFFIETPNYCLSCGKKILSRTKIFSIKSDFNMIVCLECNSIINPYYSNDGEIFDSATEIDNNLMKLCEEKLKNLKIIIKEKIIQYVKESGIDDNMIYLDYFFKDVKFIFVLVFINILNDFQI